MNSIISPKANNRLLVEGKDDLHSVIHILRRHGIDYDHPINEMPYIHSTEGYSKLLETVAVAAKTYPKLGIVADADMALSSRWTELSAKLHSIGISPPSSPSIDGTIFPGTLKNSRIGIWLMPNNIDPGMLETFLGFLVPANDKCFEYAGEVSQEAKSRGAPFSLNHIDKAKIHTWLAWRDDPGQPFGTAITASCFQTDIPVALKFVKWYQDVFLA